MTVSPELFVDGVLAYQKTAALKAVGSARPLDFLKAMGHYDAFETNRASKYLYAKGKPVYLLTQSWTDHVDKTLTLDRLPELGNILNLPKGWSFSVKTIDQDLTIAPPAPNYTAHSLVDNLKNVYAGCGFDNACSFTP
jgi:hypothetical protein